MGGRSEEYSVYILFTQTMVSDYNCKRRAKFRRYNKGPFKYIPSLNFDYASAQAAEKKPEIAIYVATRNYYVKPADIKMMPFKCWRRLSEDYKFDFDSFPEFQSYEQCSSDEISAPLGDAQIKRDQLLAGEPAWKLKDGKCFAVMLRNIDATLKSFGRVEGIDGFSSTDFQFIIKSYGTKGSSDKFYMYNDKKSLYGDSEIARLDALRFARDLRTDWKDVGIIIDAPYSFAGKNEPDVAPADFGGPSSDYPERVSEGPEDAGFAGHSSRVGQTEDIPPQRAEPQVSNYYRPRGSPVHPSVQGLSDFQNGEEQREQEAPRNRRSISVR